jgi:outer membrane protein TolC
MLVLAVIALTLCGGAMVNEAMANEIYKWTDEEGNVHYQDLPTGAPSEVRVGISYKRTDKSAIQQRQQARVDSQIARQERRDAADDADRDAAKEAAAAVAQQKQCESYRASLERYAQSQRLYREGTDGERTYLDDNEMTQARKRLEDHIAKNCSP